MSAVLLRLRAELRTRWRAWLGLAVLVGGAAGVVTATAAGAERTESAHARFLETQSAADALLYVSCVDDRPLDTGCLPAVRSDAAIAASAVVFQYTALVETADGTYVDNPDDACYSGPGDVSLLGDSEGIWGASLNRHRIVAGRAADPSRADEVVISESLADRNGIGPGDPLVVIAPNHDCVEGWSELVEPKQYDFRIVGVQRSPYEIEPSTGFYLSSVLTTPAFVASAPNHLFGRQTTLAVRVRKGHEVDEVVAAVEAAGGHAEVVPINEIRDLPDETLAPYATALNATAIVGLLVVLAVLAPVLVRRLRLDAVEQPALWALGMRRSGLRMLVIARALLLAAGAAVVTAAVAVALSPLFPIGPARSLESAARPRIDGAFVALGAVAAGALVLLAAVPALFVHVRASRSAPARRPLLSRAGRGLSVPGWCGVRLAFNRATAAAGGVVAVVVAVVALVGALTFNAGVQHLIASPRLVGQTWDVGLGFPSTAPDFPADDVRAGVARHPAVLGYGEATIWTSIIGSSEVELGSDRLPASIVGFDGAGVEPTLVSGRTPAAPNEIALGPKTLDDLHLSEGDEIDVHGYEGTWGSAQIPTDGVYRIVGTVVLPTADMKGLGHGAVMSLDGLKRLNRYSGSDVLWLRLAPGTDLDALAVDIYGSDSGMFEDASEVYIDFSGATLDVGSSDIGRVDAAPIVLAALLGLMGLGVLVQLVVGATFRNRYALAVLAALGLARRQVRATVLWQAAAYMVVPVLLGLPLGVALGRVIFHEYAARLGAVPEPVTPWLAVVVLIPLSFAIAVACATVPAWRAARRAPALALRAE